MSASATVAVYTTHWEDVRARGKDARNAKRPARVQLRKSQLKGKGKPAEFSSDTFGNDRDIVEAIAKALIAHAQELRAKE